MQILGDHEPLTSNIRVGRGDVVHMPDPYLDASLGYHSSCCDTGAAVEEEAAVVGSDRIVVTAATEERMMIERNIVLEATLAHQTCT